MNHLVSVVIPAYNAAKRIEATLLCITAQDYDNIEVIVVDDGSADDTSSVAERVLQTSGRKFKVIRHETNMGVSAARNTGLNAVSGDYVIFFDADDMADPEFVSVLLDAVTANDSDAAFCGFRNRYEDTGLEQAVPVRLNPSRQYPAGELTMRYIFQKIKPSIWSTIFKTSFLKSAGLEFTTGCMYGEDTEFMMKALSLCGSIGFSTGSHYIYMHHEDQITRTTRQTPEQSLRRYVHNAGAVCRAAQYVAEHAKSSEVRKAGRGFMLAEGLIKTMNAAARQGDTALFNRTLHDPETRRALKASLGYLTRKPEVPLKSLALLLVPSLYHRMRSKGGS